MLQEEVQQQKLEDEKLVTSLQSADKNTSPKQTAIYSREKDCETSDKKGTVQKSV